MQKFSYYTGLLMGTIFIGFGILTLVRPPEKFPVVVQYNIIIGCLVILYGAFRIWRSVKMKKTDE